jgi:glycerol-3-phosphate acyltransferase PlsY
VRFGNNQVALLTLNLNSGKIAAEVLATQYSAPEVLPLARVTVVFGHLHPVWLGFCVG